MNARVVISVNDPDNPGDRLVVYDTSGSSGTFPFDMGEQQLPDFIVQQMSGPDADCRIHVTMNGPNPRPSGPTN